MHVELCSIYPLFECISALIIFSPFLDADECFKCHDVDGDGEISTVEFESLCGNLLGKSARFNPTKVLRRLLPEEENEAKISQGEFKNIVWPRFISPLLNNNHDVRKQNSFNTHFSQYLSLLAHDAESCVTMGLKVEIN